MTKNRLLVHIALSSTGECVNSLVCAGGRFIPFDGEIDFKNDRNLPLSYWTRGFSTFSSVRYWKRYCRKSERAVRFQRVMLVGD